ncbi:histidine kinase [Streptomyces cocklensis]|uniref:histidine kinase n=1 Tax=Actinacidiphila cocklensis TaxID=887465 RepID=A0A9W4GUV7_9ACTN|nr:histidine kinase [Actinacidiphila cocklensis]MDD1064188.1 histidine kinase [Actinacidiphila cocklensis]WSX75552.1 histidine kinase [Streptomyces sp. NBC_00899]CAG6398594.1 Signal transduction histidine kinase [Actinacidiphila cocklensis]
MDDESARGAPLPASPLPADPARDPRPEGEAQAPDSSRSARVRPWSTAPLRLRVLSRWWGSRPAATRDREVAVVFTVLSFAEPLARIGAQFGDLPAHRASAASVLLALGQALPLAVRTRWPGLCLAAVGISFAVHESLGCPPTFASLGLYIALYSVGAHQHHHRRVVPLAATGGHVVFCVTLHALGSPNTWTDFVVFYVALAAMWGLGVLVRGRRAHEAERRRLSAQAAIAEERSRMARELHDVVTHHVTAMVVQAGAAQYLTASPDRVHEALEAINGTGRRALAELRFLLNVLEATGESPSRTPTPGRVSGLVEQAQAGGQPIELVEDGEPAATDTSVRLATYRVVQESLTNAAKYAAGERTLVRLAHTPAWTDVEVTTAGTTGGAAGSPALRHGGAHVSGGRGLTGLRERVEMLGGEFAAGPLQEGGFRVHARIPAGGAA